MILLQSIYDMYLPISTHKHDAIPGRFFRLCLTGFSFYEDTECRQERWPIGTDGERVGELHCYQHDLMMILLLHYVVPVV